MEVDTDIGHVTLRRYVCVDDVGPDVNPMLVEGRLGSAASAAHGHLGVIVAAANDPTAASGSPTAPAALDGPAEPLQVALTASRR